MAAAIFRTKFIVPSLPVHYQRRPRLDRLWRCGEDARLIAVTAGPGWGKSCFLADHARRLGARALWYTLDELDRDPDVLVAHLAAACGLPESAAPPLEQLAGIVGRLDRRRLLVLDDVHAIAQADAAREVLGRLLRYLPESCRLAIASRQPLALTAARLRLRGEVTGLAESDLALTPAESSAWLTRRLGRSAAPLSARIQQLTEGWPTGLEIVCQALSECDSAEHPDVLRRLAAGDGRWFDFFVEEVMTDLDDDTRRFLLMTSALPHLETELCDRLTGRDDSHALLGRLAERGLFTVPVGRHAWRYHTLLRACLRRRAEQEFSPGQQRRLRRRAAGLLAGAGEVEAAALELARAGDSRGAATLLARSARRLPGSRRPETLALALEALPEAQLRDEPALLLVRADLALLQGRWRDAAIDLRRALRAQPAAAVAGAIQARLARLALLRGRFETCLNDGRKALAGPAAPRAAERGALLAAMGVAAASLGRMESGSRLLSQALSIARRLRDPSLEGRCLFLMAANVHFIRGDMEMALRDARRARSLFADLGRNDLACHAEGVVGFVLAGLGDLAGARRSSAWALQRAEAIGYRQIAGYARLTLGECELLAGDAAAAAARFAQAGGIARELGEDALANWAHLGLAEAYWRLGDHARAAAESGRSLALAQRRRDRFCLARSLAHQGRLAARRGRAAAVPYWRRAERHLVRLGARLELARLRLWRAAAGDAAAETVLADIAASDLAFLAERLEAALAQSLRSSSPDSSRAGSRRRARSKASETTGTAPQASLHVRLLGALEIDRGGQRLPASAWRQKRARRLLNMLLNRRLQPVPREQIIETLWPEADPGKSLGNLRQSVFQLRALLEPPGAPAPLHVVAEAETLRLNLGPGGTCDLVQFEAALAKAGAERRRGRTGAEAARLQEALALWRGPYLADTPYDPGVEEAAASVRHRYLRAAERGLEILAGQRRWDELVDLARRALAEDPLHEPFAAALLQGLLRLGHRREVRLAYAQFEARMVRDLDLLPSPRLKELAEQAYDASP